MSARPRLLPLLVSLVLSGPLLAATHPGPIEVTPDQLHQRGVLLYLPFEGTTEAAFSIGRSKPWVERDLLFTTGAFGQGVQLLNKPSRYVRMPTGLMQKYKNAQSMLVYEALGNVHRRRGTLAFWVLSPWDAKNTDILRGSGMSGPCVIGISSKDVYTGFLSMTRRKAFFDTVFGGSHRTGKLTRFGTYGPKLIPLWTGDTWHHVAVTWDDRRGYALYHNGEEIYRYDDEIAWDLHQPDTIGLGSRPLASRDLWPVNADYVFDELITFCRPLTQEEVPLVRDGQYGELRPTQPTDYPFDAEGRRQKLDLGESAGRPVLKGRAMIRQWAVEQVDMKYHRRWTLVDGSAASSVRFCDGGVPFDIPVRFRFAQPSPVNHMIATVDSPNGSFAFDRDPSRSLLVLPEGRSHLSLLGEPRDELGVFFKGNSVGREVRFFSVQPGALDADRGVRYPISGTIEASRYDDAAQVMLGTLHPGDQPALHATAQAAATRSQFRRGAMHHTFIVVQATPKDRFVDWLRVVLRIKPTKKRFDAVVRVHDPLIPNRAALDIDFTVEWPAEGQAGPLDLTLGPPGLIVPAGGHLVIDMVLDTDFELEYGEGTESAVHVAEGDPKRIGHEFAQAQLRKMWPGFLRRLNQNRFMQRGETEQTNPVWCGLALAEKYDPTNEQVKAWFGWSRLRPWPQYDFGHLDKQTGPRWAVYLREAVRSMQAVIHWWLDNRSNDDCYLVGAGNQWNDITKLYNKYLCLGAIAGDTRLVDAVERYLDAHWNSGRMIGGYTYSMTDMTHSAEEASFIQPCFHVLRPGVPRHVYRDLLTASNYPKWLGKNAYGHTHFRSNFVTATRMVDKGAQGRDHCGCESPTVPGRFLWWYNGHPPTAQILTAYADSWLDDTLRATKEKPAGAIPKEVQFETDKLFHGYQAKPLVADMFLAAYQLTGDRKYLKPVQLLLEKRAEVGGMKWAISHGLNFVNYRVVTGDDSYDRLLTELAAERYEYVRADGFYQRGIERVEGELLYRWLIASEESDLMDMLRFVARSNRRSHFAYCQTDPPTDRVYPWGRAILPVVMLGGRLFDDRAADPLPSAAFVWEGIDTDVVSLVFERTPTSLKMLVHNFKRQPIDAGLRVVQLPEGRYRLATALDANGDREPDGEPKAQEIGLRRFTPWQLTLEASTTTRVELTLLSKRPQKPRPDLAVTLAEPIGKGRTVVARVHNLGCAPAANVVVQLRSAGQSLTTAKIEALSGLTDYAPQFEDVSLTLPVEAAPNTCRLLVDPGNAIEEINEANNDYPLGNGVPPAVESSPAK